MRPDATRANAADWSTIAVGQVLSEFDSDKEQGLTSEEVKQRREEYGSNELKEAPTAGISTKILRQFKSPLVFILVIAGVATLALEEFVDATVIGLAVLINIVLGVFQEERASRAFAKLRDSQKKRAKVIRDGHKMLIEAQEVVPGDIVLLESGYEVPADVRIIEAKELATNEAVLTGEWASVEKDAALLEREMMLAERSNMAWKGTLVAAGSGVGVAVATGQETELGAIAESLQEIDERPTPIQRNIKRIARFLVYVIGGAITAIFVLGLLRGLGIGEMLLVAIAVAVAAMPEGLPAAVTIVLAIGMENILKRGGLVRSLLAAETLGSTTFILTDKTGTLTEAKMKLATIETPTGAISTEPNELTNEGKDILEMAIFASDAFVEEGKDAPRKLTVHGRPIEKAVTLAGLEAGISRDALSDDVERIDYLQFESERRFNASLLSRSASRFNRLVITGAPELLIERAKFIYEDGEKVALSEAKREELRNIQFQKSSEGKRLIALSYRDVNKGTLDEVSAKENLPDGTIFAGFLVFEDPVREDIADSIATVQKAGARVVMVTGDNAQTAASVAWQAGITSKKNPEVVLGDEIDDMSDAELADNLFTFDVFARVLPKQKLRLANVLKDHGEVVAMTGDGVNDAPALQRADIGVAVGTGTEVAKEASDIVLLNNSFSIVTAAIEEGRRIIDNLRKIVAYLLSTSFSEIVVIGGALVAGAPLPILPAQILWANIIEEGLMSFSFAFEKKEDGIMERDPRSQAAKTVLTRNIKKFIFAISVITGALLLGLYAFLLSLDLPIEEVRTIMFVALSIDSMFFVLSLKNLHQPIWHINPFTNRYLLVALVVNTALLVGVVLLPPFQHLLTLTPLTALEGLLLLGVGLVNLLIIELSKYVLFERPSNKTSGDAKMATS